MKNQSIINRAAIITGLVLGAFALSAVADWSNPQQPPTGGNIAAPINVGVSGVPSLQTKFDSLLIDGSLGVVGNLIIGTSSPTKGAVLTSQDNLGTVGWASASGGGLPIGTVMGYGTGHYSFSSQTPTSCSATASPFSCSGSTPTCPANWTVISSGAIYGSCLGDICNATFMCVKTQ